MPVEDTKYVKGLGNFQKKLTGNIDNVRLCLSIKKSKNERRKVIHNTDKRQTARGISNQKSRKQNTKKTNTDVLLSLKANDFNIFIDAFNPTKNSQTEWNTMKPLLLSSDATTRNRLGNGVVGFVRNYLDRQTWKHNDSKTIKVKGFDRFGVDSRQLQESFGYEFTFKKGVKNK